MQNVSGGNQICLDEVYMKFLTVLLFAPLMANAYSIDSLVSFLEKTKTIAHSDWKQSKDITSAKNEDEHRILDVSLSNKKVSVVASFDDSSSFDDINSYGINKCHSIFIMVIPNAKYGLSDPATPEGEKLDMFFTNVRGNAANGVYSNKAKIKSWSLSVKLTHNKVSCTAIEL
jgi:hypothetical protein